MRLFVEPLSKLYATASSCVDFGLRRPHSAARRAYGHACTASLVPPRPKPPRVASFTRRVLRWVLAISTFLAFSVLAELLPNWEKALSLPKASDRIAAFEAWIEDAAKTGVQSPNAHYNLAASYWEEGKSDWTQYHLLKSISLRDSPFTRFSDLKLISSIETDLGMTDGVSHEKSFSLPRLLSKNFRTLLLTLGTWSLIFGFTLVFLKNGLPRSLAWGTVSLGFGLVLFSGSLMLLERTERPVGVLSQDEGAITLYQSEALSKKLVSLPAGTLVRVESHAEGHTKLVAPVVGWVKSENVLRF